MEGVTFVAFVVIIGGGKQTRVMGWKILSVLMLLTGCIQCAGMALIAYLYDNDDRFFPGWKLDTSWILCTVSWCTIVISATGVAFTKFYLPPEGGYELILDNSEVEERD
ncbi:hypothetical protein MMC09_004269 [Bachmanniomyces sp. S44760]|nr:hypothetical protein [Bachmanniomyces sp. S44760]